MLNYTRAGLKHVKAKVVSQSIKCDASCQVTEKAVFTVEATNNEFVEVKINGVD